MPADQQLLFADLCAKIRGMADEAALVRCMGQVLKSLLRRAGDAEFLSVVQDLTTDGLLGRPLDEQKGLAAEVVRLVLEKRPEVAIAWQALHRPSPDVPCRRAADAAPPPTVTAGTPADIRSPEPYLHAEAEALLAAYVADALDRRLRIFHVPSTRFPTVAFRHEQPFFLFDPRFAGVARRFVAEVLLPHCRPALERRIYSQAGPRLEADDEARKAFLADKRPEAWKILIERLTKWSAHHRSAEAKLAAAEMGGAAGPEFAEIDVPVQVPRTFTVLGVAFALGEKSTTRRMKVRVRASTEPTADELAALTHVTRLRDIAAEQGLDLPPSCDFMLMRTLLEFDAKKYALAAREFVALAGHAETSRQYLFDRLKFLDETYANTLSDVVALMMFHATERFGFKEIYDLCIGTALDKQAMANKRPFLQDEVTRRPRELAFQVREVLRRRYDETTLLDAVRMLLEVWSVMAKTRFRRELQAALGVFAAFPVAFAGDPDEPVLSQVGHLLHRALSADEIDAEATVAAVHAIYAPLAERLRAAARGG